MKPCKDRCAINNSNKKNRVRIAMRTRFIKRGMRVYLMMNFCERITLPLCIFTTYTPGA